MSFKGRILPLLVTALLLPADNTLAAIDWDQVEITTVSLFYPGESSLQWMYSKRNHDGAAKYKKHKKTCIECHRGDESKYGHNAVVGNEYEPKPLVGRRGYVEAQLQMAIEDNLIHVRVAWPRTQAPINWPTGNDLEDARDLDYATKLSILLDDGTVDEFTRGGCWAVCHTDEKQMTVYDKKKPIPGDKEKYLAESRSKMHRKRGGGNNILPDAEIQALLSKGVYLEYWQAALSETALIGVTDGFILKERAEAEPAMVNATAQTRDNTWIVEFTHPLETKGMHKQLVPGKEYTLGVSLHDQHTSGRYHLVSLEQRWLIENGQPRILDIKKQRK